MKEFRIRPVLGFVDAVSQNDPILFKMVGDNVALTHCVETNNIDLKRIKNTCSKSFGRTVWSNSANAQATKCLGLFELKGASATDHIYFDNGKMYVYDSSRDPINKDAAVPVTFANDNADLYSMIQYGEYIVFADRAEHQPYMWKNGDANIAVFQDTSSYKCRFLELFQQRIILAYTDQTNGDIEFRWTSRLPTAGSENIAAANQIYKETNDSITGIKNIGNNRCILYGDESVSAIDYYPSYATPFAVTTLVTNGGSGNHHGIVNVGGMHLLFSPQYGFVKYFGNTEFPGGGAPISEPIEDVISTINQNYYSQIVGTFLRKTNQVVWAVPLNGVATPSHLLVYDISSGHWTVEEKAARYIDNWLITSNLVWNNLSGLGYTTWEDFGTMEWGELFSSSQSLVIGNTDGHTYHRSGDSDNGSDFLGYRTEPIMNFGSRSLLTEIWFSIISGGNFSIDIWHRSGDTVRETEKAGWTELDSISCNDPDDAVCYLAENAKFHQIKWGTDKKNERFGVNEIIFKYASQGDY